MIEHDYLFGIVFMTVHVHDPVINVHASASALTTAMRAKRKSTISAGLSVLIVCHAPLKLEKKCSNRLNMVPIARTTSRVCQIWCQIICFIFFKKSCCYIL